MGSETCVRLKAVFFLLKEGEEMNITELNNLRNIDKEIKLLQERIEELEASTDAQFNDIYQALTQLLSQSQEQKQRRRIGFVTYDKPETDR